MIIAIGIELLRLLRERLDRVAAANRVADTAAAPAGVVGECMHATINAAGRWTALILRNNLSIDFEVMVVPVVLKLTLLLPLGVANCIIGLLLHLWWVLLFIATSMIGLLSLGAKVGNRLIGCCA